MAADDRSERAQTIVPTTDEVQADPEWTQRALASFISI